MGTEQSVKEVEPITIRTLRPNEIECRVNKITPKSILLLLYKDARVDMKILDETYGINGWQRSHVEIKGNLFCNIEIWDSEKKQWILKQDVGTESYTEKQKGEASDSFKRAGFNVGIGRELYTSPFISIFHTDKDVKDNKLKWGVKFEVQHIEYNEEREISKLILIDQNGKARYEYEQDRYIMRDGINVIGCNLKDAARIKEYYTENGLLKNLLKHYDVRDTTQLIPDETKKIILKMVEGE